MSVTGIVRGLDKLGRIVVPIEMCRALDWEAGTLIEIYGGRDDQDRPCLHLRRFVPGCLICGEDFVVGESTVPVAGNRRICETCAEEIYDKRKKVIES